MAKNGLKSRMLPKEWAEFEELKVSIRLKKNSSFLSFIAVDTGGLRDDLLEYLAAITGGKYMLQRGFSREFFCRHIEKLNHHFHNNLQYLDYHHQLHFQEFYTKLLEL